MGGVLKDHNMKAVHEKTLAKLYRGTKNLSNNNAGLSCLPGSGGDTGQLQPSQDCTFYRQLSLTPGCTVAPTNSAPTPACCSCVRTDCKTSPLYRCASCVGLVGDRCARRCNSCRATLSCGLCEIVRGCSRCGALVCSSCLTPGVDQWSCLGCCQF